MRQLMTSKGAINISDSRLMELRARFPTVDVDAELSKIQRWLDANPGRAFKTLRGVENWLAKTAMNAPRNKREETVTFDSSTHPAIVAERNYRGEEPAVYNDDVKRAEVAKCRQMLGMRP